MSEVDEKKRVRVRVRVSSGGETNSKLVGARLVTKTHRKASVAVHLGEDENGETRGKDQGKHRHSNNMGQGRRDRNRTGHYSRPGRQFPMSPRAHLRIGASATPHQEHTRRRSSTYRDYSATLSVLCTHQ